MRNLLLLILCTITTRTALAVAPDTVVGSHIETATARNNFSLSARLANESNWADGVLGPVTYGLIATLTAPTGLELDATFIRMHEPGMKPLNSVLDEGQLSLKYPLSEVLNITGTFWKNRMMDIYTTLGGLEFERALEPVSVSAGAYAGQASRFEVDARFVGAGAEIGAEFGSLEVTLSHLAGVIAMPSAPSGLGTGKYHKSGLEAAMKLAGSSSLPLRTTLGVERRYFDFGSGGPVSEPIDTWIVVLGIEVGLTGRLQP